MSETTTIEWAKSTASPWTICTEDNDECANCYAKSLAKMFGWGRWGKNQPRHFFKGFADSMRKLNRKAELAQAAPGEWRVFPSVCDIFDEEVSDEKRAEYFDVVESTPHLTHLILTKRAEKMHRYMGLRYGDSPLPHVWLLISAGRQKSLNEKLPWLLHTAATVRGVSCEPMLEGVNFVGPFDGEQAFPLGRQLHWIIFGCESKGNYAGRNAAHYEQHARAGIRQCQDFGVKVFHKQMPVGNRVSGDPAEWPADLRVREFPVVGQASCLSGKANK